MAFNSLGWTDTYRHPRQKQFQETSHTMVPGIKNITLCLHVYSTVAANSMDIVIFTEIVIV